MIYAVVADGNMRLAYEKGEIKDRYWNPGDIFDQVHVVVLADDDIEPEKVQRVAGKARLHIHPVGRVKPWGLGDLRRKVHDKMADIAPDIIRGHGPFLQGYYAVYSARQLGVPSFASIHDDISIYRRFWTYGKGYGKITVYQLALKALGWEHYVYQNADRLIPKYVAAGRLLAKSRYRDKVEVIYNQIFLSRFTDLHPALAPGERLKIINVGRQFAGKDQRPLIRALAGIDAELTLVGMGPLRGELTRTAEKSGVAGRVRFIDSIPNHELPAEFARHHIFAMNIIQPGISMTVMEAMALGFPIVINRPRWEVMPEISGECAMVVDGSPEGFREAFRVFLENPAKVVELGRRSRRVIQEYSGEKMEEKEKNLILGLIAQGKKTDQELARPILDAHARR